MTEYIHIADELANDIARGRLRPGDRLAPQRRFAKDHGIAASTAARVYRELHRRGLIVGEVGRGTFVRSSAPTPHPALTEPADASVDLELNFPWVPEQAALMAGALRHLVQPEALETAMRPTGVSGTPGAVRAAASMLSRPGWTPEPEQIVFAGNGRQAIAAAIAALVPPGGRLAVEAITYPVVKSLTRGLGVPLVPVAMDGDGLTPDGLRAAHAAAAVSAVYVQPTLHNPLGTTMTEERRRGLAAVLRDLDLYAVEDAVYGFLRPEIAPLAAFAPERTVVVDSLTKRLAPGLTVGFAAAPIGVADRLATALRSAGTGPTRLGLEAAAIWVDDGPVAAIERAKRSDAAARHELMRRCLKGFDVGGDPGSYHCWWRLPEPWRAEMFVAAAARSGVAVTPAAAFTVGDGHAPDAVRLALSSPTLLDLETALKRLETLARRAPEDTIVD